MILKLHKKTLLAWARDHKFPVMVNTPEGWAYLARHCISDMYPDARMKHPHVMPSHVSYQLSW